MKIRVKILPETYELVIANEANLTSEEIDDAVLKGIAEEVSFTWERVEP